jgi:hypothetical protein
MKITIHSTSKVVTIKGSPTSSDEIACRIWEGETESGIKVQCLIPRIAASSIEDLSQFESELKETVAPSPEAMMFPLRMIL